MSQRLILPINKSRMTANYKNANYKKEFGYTHYGVDLTDQERKDKRVWGSGNGEVTHLGEHPSCGYVMVVVYKDCECTDGKIRDIAMRYYHLEKDSFKVKVGQKITKDTVLAIYGSTGASTGDHLHIELDVDIKYPNYTPQTRQSNSVLKSGTDTTINPQTVLWVKTSSPDYQYMVSSGYNTVGSLNYKETK